MAFQADFSHLINRVGLFGSGPARPPKNSRRVVSLADEQAAGYRHDRGGFQSLPQKFIQGFLCLLPFGVQRQKHSPAQALAHRQTWRGTLRLIERPQDARQQVYLRRGEQVALAFDRLHKGFPRPDQFFDPRGGPRHHVPALVLIFAGSLAAGLESGRKTLRTGRHAEPMILLDSVGGFDQPALRLHLLHNHFKNLGDHNVPGLRRVHLHVPRKCLPN